MFWSWASMCREYPTCWKAVKYLSLPYLWLFIWERLVTLIGLCFTLTQYCIALGCASFAQFQHLYLIRALFLGGFDRWNCGCDDRISCAWKTYSRCFWMRTGVKALGRAQFVGPYVHIPLIFAASFVIAFFTRTVGFPLVGIDDRWSGAD